MRVRVVKVLPAPIMDGFEVGGLRPEHVYDVDEQLAKYLVLTGYAVRVRDPQPRQKGECPNRTLPEARHMFSRSPHE